MAPETTLMGLMRGYYLFRQKRGGSNLIPYRLWIMLAFSRIPGNALSFWIRKTLRWSRGRPSLPDESKDGLFAFLGGGAGEAIARETVLRERYRLDPLASASTRGLYRKNLYLLDILEKAVEGLPIPTPEAPLVEALDAGSQDWHYVFALERWLRFANRVAGRRVSLTGVEVDGYGIYSDFHSRRDYAEAYAGQTGNPEATFEVGDFLEPRNRKYDILTAFYPFVLRHHLLLWGLPLRYFKPDRFFPKAAALIRPGGWLLVFTHTLREHESLLEWGRASPGFALAREGNALSDLVEFHEDVADRRFSVWMRSAS